MTRYLLAARAFVIAAVLAVAGAGYSVSLGTPWLAVPCLYAAMCFGWCAAGLRSEHQRHLAELDWARRLAAGENPGPLVPCCRLTDTSGGTSHDGRCTDLAARAADAAYLRAQRDHLEDLVTGIAVPELDGSDSPFGWREDQLVRKDHP